ncbi:muscarinic acetylcholine receptor M2-like [Dreissena polymorpha]|uniref:G-protein coupled receptors family 1 profile domain-containing protein n=1 Tax=Dreissena polymorpha TaxID=45954 RepID=A0A9D4BLT4_DREPO|nr:muscarinic acetylcholine receptor M2-like [Dreissena polymorpha]XP_052254523.1 muscarinic acetylcholine receptor M2-like [Dreissena polymorpha]XP_052254524.1 muscarinic acetylcholine receptor M2-like [Dreissena polymorpha]KAH3700789.1 hypothetical protein DPMN_075768 [Dreissena polymorpha]
MSSSSFSAGLDVTDGVWDFVNDSDLYLYNGTAANIYNDTNHNTSLNGTVDSNALPHSLWLTIFLGTVATIVIIVTILGNILVLLSFFLERTIRQPTNYFIASLAMSDLLIGSFSMPCFTTYLLLGYWPFGEIICDLWLSMDYTVCLASQYTVLFITIDRFCSVKIPAKYRNWRTDGKVRLMIALSWIIPAAIFFTSIIGWQYFVGVRTVAERSCEVQFMSDPTFTFLLTIGYFWSTLIVMIALYVGIYRVALALQRKSNEKQKKMNNAMNLAKDRTSANSGKSKQSKKRMENNNARYLREANDNNTLTTSFSKHSDNEYSKPSEEDRSSSPAFASDEDEGSSADIKTTGCYVNSAVQTEPTLKGMLGTSANHIGKSLAFSLSGTSVSASQASHSSTEKDTTDDKVCSKQTDSENQNSLIKFPKSLTNSFRPITDINQIDHEDDIHDLGQLQISVKTSGSTNDLLDHPVLDGIRYIDEDSLKSLTSSDNVKLLAEIKDLTVGPPRNDKESPVWRRRVFDDDKSLLVPQFCDSASSEAISTGPDECSGSKVNKDLHNVTESMENHTKKGKKSQNNKKHLRVHHNVDSNKTKHKRHYGSPLQSLVRSLRPAVDKKKKPAKSKSENRARKALRTISIILGAYVLCWTPFHIMIFVIGICKSFACINMQLYNFSYWLCYLNSPINPFCYAFANAQFKRTFIRILKLDFHRT